MSVWEIIGEHITAATAKPFAIQRRQNLSGGCINRAYRLQGGNRDYFVKLNVATKLAMFEAEAAGLEEIATNSTVKTPRPVCWGRHHEQSYLVLEYLELRSASDLTMVSLGKGLAQMHQQPRPYFGWHRENTIGATPQHNGRYQDWASFWRRHRLGFQLDLAERNGYGDRLSAKGDRLLAGLDALFKDYPVVPALLHGDLWAGNVASLADGGPVIFDPAVYYGDREADLAMTELFGGFSPCFYDAYRETYPLHDGYRTRRVLYNLYHVLNHLNLFGGAYLGQTQHMLDKLLAELG